MREVFLPIKVKWMHEYECLWCLGWRSKCNRICLFLAFLISLWAYTRLRCSLWSSLTLNTSSEYCHQRIDRVIYLDPTSTSHTIHHLIVHTSILLATVTGPFKPSAGCLSDVSWFPSRPLHLLTCSLPKYSQATPKTNPRLTHHKRNDHDIPHRDYPMR